MFAGRTNNEMLRLVMAVKGRPPNRLLKAHLRAYEALQLEPHFDADLRFRLYEMDAISSEPCHSICPHVGIVIFHRYSLSC